MLGFYPISSNPISALRGSGTATQVLADTITTSDSFSASVAVVLALSDTISSSDDYEFLLPPGISDLSAAFDTYTVFTTPYQPPLPVFPSVLPVGWSVHKKPIMASRAVQALTGREAQMAGAAYPRWSFVLKFGDDSWLRDETQNIVPYAPLAGYTEFQQLTSLWLASQACFGEFYYSDPDDCSRSDQAVGTGDGTTKVFPLTYSWGTGPFTPPMTIPVGGIEVIDAVYFNGVAISSGLYNLDPTRTKLIFVSAPAAGVVITTDFYFYFRCRFLDDTFEFSEFAENLWSNKECRFESVKQ